MKWINVYNTGDMRYRGAVCTSQLLFPAQYPPADDFQIGKAPVAAKPNTGKGSCSPSFPLKIGFDVYSQMEKKKSSNHFACSRMYPPPTSTSRTALQLIAGWTECKAAQDYWCVLSGTSSVQNEASASLIINKVEDVGCLWRNEMGRRFARLSTPNTLPWYWWVLPPLPISYVLSLMCWWGHFACRQLFFLHFHW